MFRIIYFFLFCCLYIGGSAQVTNEAVLTFNAKDHKIGREESLDPKLLVAALTAGKNSDKEKFDAIYGWVATNIFYDYRQFFSSSGAYSLSTKEILRRRTVVCLGYANLMDSLCALAGITNTTVYGYATDELFDVHDSIFVDNHAWNAVKLDGLWYVYDVTWSTGSIVYKLKRFSRFIDRLLQKFPPKYKEVKIRVRKRKRDCPDNYTGPAFYYRQKFINWWWRHFLRRFTPRYKRTYIYQLNTKYYLTQPELFATTHCPNDPIWSLGAVKNISSFANDSAYYYDHDSLYTQQVREGRECPACDSMLELSPKEKLKAVERNAYKANHRNHFVMSEHEYRLGVHNLFDSFTETADSLKLLYLDSSFANFSKARVQLKAQKTINGYDASLQKMKNRKKVKLLLSENKMHRNLVRKRIRYSLSHGISFRQVETKSEALARGWRGRATRINHLSTGFKTYSARKGSEMKAARKRVKMEHLRTQADSLITLISALKNDFDSIVQIISLNIWNKGRIYDTLENFFYKRIDMRYRLLDNYKKPVEDMRIKIANKEFDLNNDLDFLFYTPATKAEAIFRKINKMIQYKNKLQLNCLSHMRDLVKIEKEPMSMLEDYKAEVIADAHNDYCWMESILPHIISGSMGFDFLRWQQRKVDEVIPKENRDEKERGRRISDRIYSRYRRYNNIADANQSLIRRRLHEVKTLRSRMVHRKK